MTCLTCGGPGWVQWRGGPRRICPSSAVSFALLPVWSFYLLLMRDGGSCREESQSEDATQVHAGPPLSGASTPTAVPGAVQQSVDLSLSPSVSQTLDRSAKRPPPPAVPARRKQLCPSRAAE